MGTSNGGTDRRKVTRTPPGDVTITCMTVHVQMADDDHDFDRPARHYRAELAITSGSRITLLPPQVGA
jgi:hypothetical protein